ncbi:MAG: lysophospholipid acyltransferase family protein [Nitrospirota bacterium]
MVVYIIFYLLGWRFISIVGKLVGDVVYILNSRKMEILEEELSLLFGNRFDERRIKDITKRSFENYYKRQIESVFFGSLNKHTLNKIIHVEGIENLDSAISKGKGVILLLSHFGSFLLPLPSLGYMGYKVNQITGRQIHSSLLAERIWIWRKRKAERLPVKFIQGGKFLRPVYKALKNNEVVAIAFDGRDGSKWVAVDFFERKALLSSGPFELARKTGATIIPAFIIREKNDTHKLVLESPFKLSEDRDIGKALANDTRNFAELFANYIVKYPCHFGMVLYKLKKIKAAAIDNPFFVET